RKEFRPVQDWIRTTEVTSGIDGRAQTHFHTLMMEPHTMYPRYSFKQARWVQLWRERQRVENDPRDEVREVNHRKPK
ncbi:hypothetical protein AF376_23215, partial [Salmonella enterica subsp. enterica serovar Typhimurium]|uniref:protein rep n=1 Tax=Salmonella enterica TaxID=28901 RepID=UPI00079940C7